MRFRLTWSCGVVTWQCFFFINPFLWSHKLACLFFLFFFSCPHCFFVPSVQNISIFCLWSIISKSLCYRLLKRLGGLLLAMDIHAHMLLLEKLAGLWISVLLCALGTYPYRLLTKQPALSCYWPRSGGH